MSPLLLLNEKPFTGAGAHDIEAFGPVSTLMPYKDLDEAILLSKKGKGSLCSNYCNLERFDSKRLCGGCSYPPWQNFSAEPV